jgi:hypothetical protein
VPCFQLLKIMTRSKRYDTFPYQDSHDQFQLSISHRSQAERERKRSRGHHTVISHYTKILP